MKEFLLLVHKEDEHLPANKLSAGQEHSFLKSCEVYIEKLKSTASLKSAQPLERNGRFISCKQGEWAQGPLNESKYVIAGYYHLRARDLSDAIELAKGNPEFKFFNNARIEIRPIKGSEESTGYIYPK